VAASDAASKPGDALIVVRPTELKCAKDSTPLTPGTELLVKAGDNASDEHGVLVSLVAIGRIGRVDRAAVIPKSEAIGYFSAAIEKNPSDPTLLLARGKVWFHLRKPAEGFADLNAGLRLHPDSGALTVRAWAWKQKGEADKAIADFDEAIRLDPNNSLALRVRGATWANKDDYAKALADFNEAIRVDPYNVDALNHRASFMAGSKHAEFRNGQQAVADATRACELTDWKVSRYLGTLAAAYSTQGDFDAALKWNAKAIELTPDGQRKYLIDAREMFEKKQPFRRDW
jgi:tetratricopeptide (TPR) repeat protein